MLLVVVLKNNDRNSSAFKAETGGASGSLFSILICAIDKGIENSSNFGEFLTNASNRITKQPYGGVFFTSQNASTWTASQMEDLKFKINRASFSTTSGTVTLQNDAIPDRTLPSNPIIMASPGATSLNSSNSIDDRALLSDDIM
mgnify:CR=1 FL=1